MSETVCINCENSGQNSNDEKRNQCWCGLHHSVVSERGYCNDFEQSAYISKQNTAQENEKP